MRIRATILESKLRGVGAIERDYEGTCKVGDILEDFPTICGHTARVRVTEIIPPEPESIGDYFRNVSGMSSLAKAAPDLLAALERALHQWDTDDGDNWAEDARAAIAKAKGHP